jgi:hypothetical protein
MVETTTLLALARQNGATVLRNTATVYTWTDAITQKGKQEFGAGPAPGQRKTQVPESKPRERPGPHLFESGDPAASLFFPPPKSSRENPL